MSALIISGHLGTHEGMPLSVQRKPLIKIYIGIF